MRVLKCDLCKRQIPKNREIDVGIGFSSIDLCIQCAAPIVRFVKRHKLASAKELAELQTAAVK